jgi:DNA-binding MarR family transcriptional regulator
MDTGHLQMSDTADTEMMSKEDYVRLARFRYAIRRFLEFSKKSATSRGLTSQQHQALLSIKSFPDRDAVTVGELAHHLCIRQNSAVELVDRLEALGLVARETSAVDRRRVLLSLTPSAEAVLSSLSAANLQELRRLAPSFATLVQSLTAPSASVPKRGRSRVSLST